MCTRVLWPVLRYLSGIWPCNGSCAYWLASGCGGFGSLQGVLVDLLVQNKSKEKKEKKRKRKTGKFLSRTLPFKNLVQFSNADPQESY